MFVDNICIINVSFMYIVKLTTTLTSSESSMLTVPFDSNVLRLGSSNVPANPVAHPRTSNPRLELDDKTFECMACVFDNTGEYIFYCSLISGLPEREHYTTSQ
jgi:hypothetical protein